MLPRHESEGLGSGPPTASDAGFSFSPQHPFFGRELCVLALGSTLRERPQTEVVPPAPVLARTSDATLFAIHFLRSPSSTFSGSCPLRRLAGDNRDTFLAAFLAGVASFRQCWHRVCPRVSIRSLH